jgi:hypothetical protein
MLHMQLIICCCCHADDNTGEKLQLLLDRSIAVVAAFIRDPSVYAGDEDDDDDDDDDDYYAPSTSGDLATAANSKYFRHRHQQLTALPAYAIADADQVLAFRALRQSTVHPPSHLSFLI